MRGIEERRGVSGGRKEEKGWRGEEEERKGGGVVERGTEVERGRVREEKRREGGREGERTEGRNGVRGRKGVCVGEEGRKTHQLSSSWTAPGNLVSCPACSGQTSNRNPPLSWSPRETLPADHSSPEHSPSLEGDYIILHKKTIASLLLCTRCACTVYMYVLYMSM